MARAKNKRQSSRDFPVLLLGLLLVGVVASLYVNTLSHEFVFDDVTLIEQNPEVTNLDWLRILGRSGYRPLRTLTYAINFAIGGLDPFGYHLFNLLIHAANTLLVFWLFLRLLRRIDTSFLGALFFAVHPVQTAAVAYVSGRKDLLASFFLLAALLCYLSWRRGEGRWWLAGATLSVVLAVLSKEVAVVFPFMFFLVDLYRRARPDGGKDVGNGPIKGVFLYPAMLVLALVAVYYAVVLTEASRMVGYWGGSLSHQWATSFKLFVHYIRLVVFPYPLIADYTGVFPVSTGFAEPATLLCILLSVAYGVLGILVYRRWPEVSLGMGWFLVPLLPVLQIVGFHEIAADHFLYLPLLGAALLFGFVVSAAISSPSWNVLAWAFSIAVFVSFSFLTVTRNQVWKNQLQLWEDTLAKAPHSYRANANLGQIYFKSFRDSPGADPRIRARAIQLLERASQLKPEDSLPYSNLGAVYRHWGWTEYLKGNLGPAEELANRALDYLSKAVATNPQDLWAYSNLGDVRKDLGLIWERRGDPLRAETERQLSLQAYQKAIDIGSAHPSFPIVDFKVGMVHVDRGKIGEAIPFLQKAAQSPGLADMWEPAYWMGYCYVATGRVTEAIPHLRKAVRLGPAPEFRRLLGFALDRAGQRAEAMKYYEDALRRDPNSPEGHWLMGVALAEEDRLDAARSELLKARDLVVRKPQTVSTRALQRTIEEELNGVELKSGATGTPASEGVRISVKERDRR